MLHLVAPEHDTSFVLTILNSLFKVFLGVEAHQRAEVANLFCSVWFPA